MLTCKKPWSRVLPTLESGFSAHKKGVSRHACHQFYPGPGGNHAGRRRRNGPFSSSETARGPGLYRCRFHYRPAHTAVRPDPRRGYNQDLRRAGCYFPDVLSGPGIQPAQAVQGRCHGLYRGFSGNRADDLDRLRNRAFLQLERHGLAVSRGDSGDFFNHHHRQSVERPEDEKSAFCPADFWDPDRRRHSRYWHYCLAVRHRGQRLREFRRGIFHRRQAVAVYGCSAGDRYSSGPAPVGVCG